MRVSFIPSLGLVLACAAVATAQPNLAKDAARLAEVRFSDGSVVRMTVLQETLDVQTKYGKLVIPVTDIRRIEMGLHLPEGLQQTIDQSIRLLSSEGYKQREDATKELLTAGHWAMPALQKASNSPELEVAKRAQLLVQKITEKASPEFLKLKAEDTVQTQDFQIVGRITSTTVKAYSPLFGEQLLKLSDLRSMHLRGQRGEAELSLDSAKFGSNSDQWFDTGLNVDNQLRVIVQADGQVDLWPQTPGQYMAHPRGFNTPGKGGAYLAGALIGRVGENGRTFLIGERYEGISSEEGRLFLHIVPSPWNNASSGNYRVRVQTEHLALSTR